jgi:uncharacterized protein YqeY
MNPKTQLENALKDAMRAKDEVRKRAIRMALAAIKLAEVDARHELDETALFTVLQKEIKTHQETISEAQRAGRQDMVSEKEAEITILQEFLPQPLTPEALETLVREVIVEVEAKTPADLGKVMKVLLPRLQGRATGSEASQVVRKLLQ